LAKRPSIALPTIRMCNDQFLSVLLNTLSHMLCEYEQQLTSASHRRDGGRIGHHRGTKSSASLQDTRRATATALETRFKPRAHLALRLPASHMTVS
jgi:hypothetical protein